MSTTMFAITGLIVLVFLIILRVKWTNLEVTRQGCNITMSVVPGISPEETIQQCAFMRDGFGVTVKETAPTVDTGTTVTVYELDVVRIPFTNIRIGKIHYVLTTPEGLSVYHKRVTSIAKEIYLG